MTTQAYTNLLATKLARVLGSFEPVPKTGKNNYDNYNFQEASILAGSLKEHLAEVGVFMFCSVVEIKESDYQSQKGTLMNRCVLKMEAKFVDGESGGEMSVYGYGCGDDRGDKHINKANTAALKYIIKSNFLVPDRASDADAYGAEERFVGEELRDKNSQPRNGDELINHVQAKAFADACLQYGRTEQQVRDYLAVSLKVPSVEQIAKKDYQMAIKWALNRPRGKPELVDEVAASVKAVRARKKKTGDPLDSKPNGEHLSDEELGQVAGD
jgi:hypothetical protein